MIDFDKCRNQCHSACKTVIAHSTGGPRLFGGAFGLERLIDPARGTHFDFASVDFASIAKGLGCHGVRIERPSEVRDALEAATKSDRPTLIDCVVDPHAKPPMKGLDA